jgi:CRISPR/Cas system-associated exonuclease Cas4 (RecB family)
LTEIKRFRYTPILGWSASRYGTFDICKRKYFYQYYGKFDPEIPKRRIDQFKALVSVPLETGSLVHHVIEVLLNRLQTTTERIDRERFLDFARRSTEHRLERKAFEETTYGLLDGLTADDLMPKIQLCLDNLLASERYAWLKTIAIDSAGSWVIDPPGYGETRIDDLKVYCKVDFLFPIEGELHIVDWKTGQVDPDKHRRQLMGYSTWASFHFEVPADQVKPTIAYLQPEYSEVHETFNDFDLESFAIQVRAETTEMYEYCRDVSNNIPIDKAGFPKVDNRRICDYCKFRGICWPDEYPVDWGKRNS